VEERRDVRVREGDERPRLFQQRRAIGFVAREIGWQEPYRHGAAETRIAGAIQLAGTCRLETLQQGVMRDRTNRCGRAHGLSSSMTLCTSSLASPICSSTSAMSSVGLPGTRVLWQ